MSVPDTQQLQLMGDTLLCTGTCWDEKTSHSRAFLCKADQFTLERHQCFIPKIYDAFLKHHDNIAPKQFFKGVVHEPS